MIELYYPKHLMPSSIINDIDKLKWIICVSKNDGEADVIKRRTSIKIDVITKSVINSAAKKNLTGKLLGKDVELVYKTKNDIEYYTLNYIVQNAKEDLDIACFAEEYENLKSKMHFSNPEEAEYVLTLAKLKNETSRFLLVVHCFSKYVLKLVNEIRSILGCGIGEVNIEKLSSESVLKVDNIRNELRKELLNERYKIGKFVNFNISLPDKFINEVYSIFCLPVSTVVTYAVACGYVAGDEVFDGVTIHKDHIESYSKFIDAFENNTIYTAKRIKDIIIEDEQANKNKFLAMKEISKYKPFGKIDVDELKSICDNYSVSFRDMMNYAMKIGINVYDKNDNKLSRFENYVKTLKTIKLSELISLIESCSISVDDAISILDKYNVKIDKDINI